MIEFSVRRGRGIGATVELAPGNAAPDWDEAINVDEEAFFLVESLISPALPSGEKIDHYGMGTINASAWNTAVRLLEQETIRLSQYASGGSYDMEPILQLNWIVPHENVKREIEAGGSDCVLEVVRMFHDIIDITRGWTNKYVNVFYFGV
jgi:hypothetical protein